MPFPSDPMPTLRSQSSHFTGGDWRSSAEEDCRERGWRFGSAQKLWRDTWEDLRGWEMAEELDVARGRAGVGGTWDMGECWAEKSFWYVFSKQKLSAFVLMAQALKE